MCCGARTVGVEVSSGGSSGSYEPQLIGGDFSSSGGGAFNTTDLSSSQSAPALATIDTDAGEEGDKWSCIACTFLNFPKSAKCTMCGFSRLLSPSSAASGAADGTAGGLTGSERNHLQAQADGLHSMSQSTLF
jgi:hypothetical protein